MDSLQKMLNSGKGNQAMCEGREVESPFEISTNELELLQNLKT
jgi:hypothetical protein